jgi:hypothetical protein
MLSARLRALSSGLAFSKLLRRLHSKRRRSRLRELATRQPRRRLTPEERKAVLQKTGSRCHICGDRIPLNQPWAADHILAHAHGGRNSVDNLLPAHKACNTYRRHFGAEEFAWILKLGVWMRGEVAKQRSDAIKLADRFAKHHKRLNQRRVSLDG